MEPRRDNVWVRCKEIFEQPEKTGAVLDGMYERNRYKAQKINR